MKIPGLSFSLKRAVGITAAKQKIARKTGIPTTKQGLERKVGRMVLGALFGKKKWLIELWNKYQDDKSVLEFSGTLFVLNVMLTNQ